MLTDQENNTLAACGTTACSIALGKCPCSCDDINRKCTSMGGKGKTQAKTAKLHFIDEQVVGINGTTDEIRSS